MNFNTILYRFGIDPENFINCDCEPIKTEKGFVYELTQKGIERKCSYCGKTDTHVHSHRFIEVNCSQTSQFKNVLRIRRVRMKCLSCGKTFTIPINGIDAGSAISQHPKKITP